MAREIPIRPEVEEDLVVEEAARVEIKAPGELVQEDVQMMEDGVYGGYSEPCDQWEDEGRVTLDGAELELWEECKAPVHYYGPDGAPYCEVHWPGTP